jgi:tetratricopeptide (TPR) repeat protein
VHVLLGIALLNQGDRQGAQNSFSRATRLDSRNTQMLLQIARAYQEQNDLAQALLYFQQATRVQPSLIEAQAGVADIALLQKNYAQASTGYQQVIKLSPQNAQAHFNYGLALQGLNRKSEAITAFEKAQELFKQQGNQDGFQKAESAIRALKSDLLTTP